MLKKLSLLAICTLIAINLFAQKPVSITPEPVTKKGIPILPHQGNWGIGFDVVPVIKYAGNLFHASDNHADLSINYPLSITANYFHRDNITYRFTLSLVNSSAKEDSLVPKLGSTNPNEQVSDESIASKNREVLGFGIQRWIGNSRVRGYYGGEGAFMLDASKRTYNYGNDLGATNPVNSRTSSEKDGTGVGFQLRAFLGVAVFIAPKIAISAEYGLSPLSILGTGANEIVTDSWDGSAVKTETKSTIGKTSTIGFFNTDNNNGSINLLFYF